eukprot:2271368-Pleurochrysis_carterae.AAC.5
MRSLHPCSLRAVFSSLKRCGCAECVPLWMRRVCALDLIFELPQPQSSEARSALPRTRSRLQGASEALCSALTLASHVLLPLPRT